MKLIEALKKIKELQKKADDLRDLVKANCARSSLESDQYENQRNKVEGWIQAHSDVLKEILRLRIAIQKTNLECMVVIEIGGKNVTKSIAEWIHRRRDLSGVELSMWDRLTDRGIQEGYVKGPSGDNIKIEIVRHFNPEKRDEMKSMLQSEPFVIDSKLEVVNAITDLIE